MGQLYFGDNLDILREHIQTESVDLIYLDPPFNSKRDYSLLFKMPEGHESGAESPQYPDLSRGAVSFKKAKAETVAVEQPGLL